jgi:hypothetical protein
VIATEHAQHIARSITATVRALFRRLLGGRPAVQPRFIDFEAAPPSMPARIPEPSETPPQLPPQQADQRSSRRKRTQEPVGHETLTTLLENIDASFSTMRVPEFTSSWLDKRSVKAIHKLGVYVEQDWELQLPDDPRIPSDLRLPAIASCFMLHPKHESNDSLVPRFAFAIKQPALPSGVEQIKGTAYQFGECYESNERRHDRNSRLRTLWVWAWVVVRPDGSIAFPRERRQVVHQLWLARRGNRSSRMVSYSAPAWNDPALVTGQQNGGNGVTRSRSEAEHGLACTFRQMLLWWAGRESRWSVGVNKDGRRVTFSIDPRNTASYFADRNKVVTAGGRAKKIIHFVAEHRRANGSVVKAHVRGLREFEWRGYRCIVTAPKLNGYVASAGFDLTPAFAEEGAPGMLEIDQVAQVLVDAEEHQKRA